MQVNSCLPIIPSADLERSLRFWVDGLGLTVEREMREAGRLVGCMLGYAVSSIAKREYGQSEFFVTDDDGYSHCFVPTGQGPT